MSEWLYRRGFTITNNTLAPATDFQVKFQVYRTAGTSTATDVYIGTNCLEDFSDIRFTDSSGVYDGCYDYWIETPTTSTVATCWVEVRYLPANSATTCYLYYGNSNGVSAYSSGSYTFPFFEDFLGSAIDTTKWAVIQGLGSGRHAVADSVLTWTKLPFAIGTSISTFGDELDLGIRYYEESPSGGGSGIEWRTTSNEVFQIWKDGSNDLVKMFNTAGTGYDVANVSTVYGITNFVWGLGDWLSVYVGGEKQGDSYVNTNTPATIRLGNAYYGGDREITTTTYHVDWIYLRKGLSIAPTVSGWLSSEDLTGDDDLPAGVTQRPYRIVGIEYDQNKGVFILEFGAVEDYYMTQDAKYRGAYNNTLSLL